MERAVRRRLTAPQSNACWDILAYATVRWMTNSVAPPNLGVLLNSRRKALSLTLDNLAGKSGVSRSMLSQIERGEASPTFSILWNITQALGLSIADLMQQPEAASATIEVVAAHFTPEIRTPDTRCVLQILSPAAAAGHTEWYHLTLKAGGELVSEAHAPGSTEHLTILTGRVRLEAGAGAADVESGETARYSVDVAHRIFNPGQHDAHALLVVMLES